MTKKLPIVKNSVAPTRRTFLKGTAAAGAAAGVTVLAQRQARAACSDTPGPEIWPDQDNSEVRWGFLIDLRRCTGCTACSVACKTGNDVRLGKFRNGVVRNESGTYPAAALNYVPWLCNHCANPPCLSQCPVEKQKQELTFPSGTKVEYWARATYQRPDGLVLIDQDRCVGCGKCVTSCPYQARYLDPVKDAGGDPADYGLTIDEPKAADKCTMCVHRLENGVVPSCVNTCPASARMMGNLNDANSDISLAIAAAGTAVKALKESGSAEARCYYIDLTEADYDNGTEPRREAGLQLKVPTLS